ncbi:S41 family peptidase [Flavobacteriales bacterium]|jgi:carboxyl-terminal processing protease|nr:S41 family peptidase [Flavobacteriales bacterium]
MKKSKIYFLAGFLSLILLSFVELEDTSDRFEVGKNLDIFTEVYKQVNSLYVDGTQPGELMKVGIDAMLKSLDPYTVYYPESDIEDYKLMTTGQYGGIGARIRKIDDFVVVGEPYVGFPAFKAGLRGGDVILKVDGKDVKGKSTSDLSKILKGNPGTSITVTIQRPGTEADFEVSFKREKVQIKSVPYQGMITENVGYIKMKSFTRNVSKEVKTAFLELKKNPNFQSLVFDLRGNPGGLLHEAINIVGLFTKKGVKVVETRGKIEEWTKIYKTLNAPLDKEIPIVILVDGGSASASEIVSGALQDFDRAVILGSNTYGKGLVQTTRNLKYNTSIKVTTAKYYIPSGRCIQAIDYAHKDEDGNPKKIPDSLLTEFKTQNGRLVLDGAGIKPDVEKDSEKYGAITRALLSKNHVFNFATKYVLEHDSISNAKNFRLTDDEYQSFITYLLDNEYDYQTSTGKGLKALKKSAEKDSILVDIASEIKLIEDKIILKKKLDLNKFKSQIKGFLEIEIASRFFFQVGKIESSLGNDLFVDEAVEILTNKDRYTSILSGN